MEKVLCDVHGSVCMLKTGVKDGPNKGKSFYVCVDKQGCDFTHVARISPSNCLQHEDSMVELQALTYSLQQQSHRLFYRCIVGKKAAQKWCGNVPWRAPEKEKRNPLSHAQPSCLPPVRNPFKASGKTDADSEWRRMQRGGGGEDRDGGESHGAEGGGRHQKENVEGVAAGEREAESYRGKQLPPGMKLKKRVSNEEEKRPKASGGGEPSDADEEPGEARQPTERVKDTGESDSDSRKNPPPSTQAAQPEPSRPPALQVHDDDEDDVVVVSVKPATQRTPPVSAVQKTLTAFAGFQPASKVKGQQQDPGGLHGLLTSRLQQKKATLSAVNVAALPDKGERLKSQVKELQDALESLNLAAPSPPAGSQGGSNRGETDLEVNPCRQGGTILLHAPPGPSQQQDLHLSQGCTQVYGAGPQAFYGGRMTDDRLLAVKNATSETIDHLHKSLESCPDPEAEFPDPKGIKVPLLAHQRRALAWLLWRENQNPCGGILADDMGLGKTLTIIALILAKKTKANKEAETKPQSWISKTDSSLVASTGTLIICPASLVHHWKREIERHVKTGKLMVYLYHGPQREKRANVLADFDVVVTTYSLVSKEVPVQKGGAENSSKDADEVPSRSAPLLRVAWARVVLDEAHNIKNPKVQTSMAVCQLRARARWAVTGTPIQNNLLDMYSLLKFLCCSPFDEYKVWKAQVDNGSNRGRERLNILTRTLLLRRTKAQRDSEGKPLVSLPGRTCEVHRLELSRDEQAVYDVVFAQSRSTLQNYLKRHEGSDGKGDARSANPFDKVAQEFGVSQAASTSQQASSTVHILSLLLRLRQCCCPLSLLQKTLDTSELQGDGVVLSLEEQLNALSLSSGPSPGSDPLPPGTVALNGTRFASRLFEDTSESTKIAAIVSELKAIRQKGADQKSVIVSQWTSMLRIVAVHLRGMGLRYAVIDGTVAPKHRMDLVEEFNSNARGPQVMLVSLCAGGVGLNLIGGNHLFLIDMHWNPALEDQACDRIYRVGQSKDVTIHRFVCDGTVEEKISTLQEKKKELAQNVLSGTGSTVSKLSLADLRIIFGV
uniref:transcription termination factor 2 n=1 Tax=Gasterosteus aculeatus aculeatus TaxID=481459 RepID=UPI001A98E953|nr:transcription termination factor 2 [Gasterosteus aculeatus aculeatus]